MRCIASLCLLLGLTAQALAQPASINPRNMGAGGDADSPVTLIQAGTLLAVPGNGPQTDVTLVIRGDRIEAVVQGLRSPADLDLPQADVIDLSDAFVLPGLMDAHVHLRSQPFDRQVPRGFNRARTELTPAQKAVNAIIYARRTLAAGFTTVRDLGSDDQSVFAARDAIAQGRVVGPRILVSGASVAVTAGHADTTNFDENSPTLRMQNAVCDGPAECRRAVRYQAKMGADVIKVTITGGFASNTKLLPQLFPDELKAIIDTAHQLDLKVAAHAYHPDAIRDAVAAGVDSIEHGFLVSDDGLRMMKKAGAFLVPTISASYPPPFLRIPDPPSVRLRNEYAAFERANKMGVKVAFGTDAGTFTHGDNAKEFDLMVRYGMAPEDAIRAATIVTADLFGIADIGTLAAGQLADVISVTGNPLEDITALHVIDFVMKSGQVAKRDGTMLDGMTYPPMTDFGPDGP